MTEQAAAGLARDLDAAVLAAVDVRDAVVLGEPFVDEGVVGRQEVRTLRSSRITLSTRSSVSR